jgi:hypothetical protein
VLQLLQACCCDSGSSSSCCRWRLSAAAAATTAVQLLLLMVLVLVLVVVVVMVVVLLLLLLSSLSSCHMRKGKQATGATATRTRAVGGSWPAGTKAHQPSCSRHQLSLRLLGLVVQQLCPHACAAKVTHAVTVDYFSSSWSSQ